MGVLSHALFLKGVDLDTFFEGSRQMVKIYNFLCTEAKTIREKVFMEEQGFKNEFDEYDEMVPHAVLFMEGCAVATGRLLPGERSGDFIIGRVAVLPEFRGRNLGAQICWHWNRKHAELAVSGSVCPLNAVPAAFTRL